MSNQPCAASTEEISKWIEAAASKEMSRLYPPAAATSGPNDERRNFNSERIEASLLRARTKSFVRMLKPFRRVFRNQGAVNDSLIEAVHHLAAQNEEMMERITEMRLLITNLRSQMRRMAREDVIPESRTAAEQSIGITNSPDATTPDRQA